jgi:hypothetical protein
MQLFFSAFLRGRSSWPIMSTDEAVERLNIILAHLWMVRTFLKHAPEIEEDEVLLDVPRTLFDAIRAVEPARERGDYAEFLRRLKGKLPKLRRVAELLQREHKRVADHTNFQMAATSLAGAVKQMEEIFSKLKAAATVGDSRADEQGMSDSDPAAPSV